MEPAIFGTLLERALDPDERHALGAHYTPRAYVERLVLPTIVEPLRGDWAHVQAAALVLADEAGALEGKARAARLEEACALVRNFLHTLANVRVLDPACGSGNFLYVTLEHLKRLEGEVLNQLDALGDTQGRLDLAGVSVDPHQPLGIEINPRAAEIAEMVLWIGYLQWHFRTRGNVNPPEPVLKDFRNIENRDAVLAYDRVEYVTDAQGRPVTRWDGKTMKRHPVTGEDVPDERAQVPVERYVNPRKAEWPVADFVVGNPPFIGTKRMRGALGDGYVDALRAVWITVPESADFVMYWWDHAARLTSERRLQRFGLITTNSLRQTFNRRVIEAHLSRPSPTGRGAGGEGQPLSLAVAIPDHPWVDSADGAAVRIAMTVVGSGGQAGRLVTVSDEREGGGEGIDVTLTERRGAINADLSVGADIVKAVPLAANARISGMGVALHGAGFVLDPAQAGVMRAQGPEIVRPYLGGKDLLHAARERYLIDFSGMSEEIARRANPAAFQHLLDYVKPERDHNRRESIRTLWWRFGWERPLVRAAIKPLRRYVGTTETAKHRLFQFVGSDVLCDHMVICIAVEDGYLHGVLSSGVHVTWALAAGGTLEDRPRYNKTRCFETFPFPAAAPNQQSRIRDLAGQLDAHRKRQQAQHPNLTLTGMYNVLEKLKAGEPLSAKEKGIHQQGLVSVLKSLHDEIDRAVLEAYGWSDLEPLMDVVNGNVALKGDPQENPPGEAQVGRSGFSPTVCYPRGADTVALKGDLQERPRHDPEENPRGVPQTGRSGFSPTSTSASTMTRDEAKRLLDETLLDRLVALNAERAAEEKRGLIRWLRPEFQNPQGAGPAVQNEIESTDETGAVLAPVAAAGKQAWPKDLTEQIKAVAAVLAEARGPQTEDDLAARFTGRGRWRERLPKILDMLVALGRVAARGGRYFPQP